MGEETNDEARTLAEEQSVKGKFSLIERLQGRNLPSEDVSIFLDEGAAWRREVLKDKLGDETDRDKVKALEDELAEVTKAVLASEVVLHVQGISSERYDELLKEAEEAHPTRYEEFKNPLTGQKTKTPLENEEQTMFFDLALLAECLQSAEIEGYIDEDIDRVWVDQFKKLAPLDAVRRLVTTVYKMRMAVQWMDEIQNEDFSPRP